MPLLISLVGVNGRSDRRSWSEQLATHVRNARVLWTELKYRTPRALKRHAFAGWPPNQADAGTCAAWIKRWVAEVAMSSVKLESVSPIFAVHALLRALEFYQR
ncbi:MAG: hypothetical protein ACRD19_05695, partial [Terriglobia bacterium]